jgi:hypothetical protein
MRLLFGRRPPTARGQAALMGFIFLLVFSSYLTIQGFAVQLYGEALASDMEFVLYGVRTWIVGHPANRVPEVPTHCPAVNRSLQ